MSAEDVEEYAEVIVHLGGEVSYSQTLDAQVTHLVAKLLSRSERTLMSIVSGRWVLTPSYLDHCLKAGHFVEVSWCTENWYCYVKGEDGRN